MVFPRTPCVLLLKTDVLVKRAFASLLSLGCDLEIVVSEAVDTQELIDDISKTKPDAVLFSESIPFSQKDALSQLLMTRPMPRLIIVSQENNYLHIFSREERLVTDLSDLLTAIHVA